MTAPSALFSDIPFAKLEEADIKRLINAGAPETSRLEYKRETYRGDNGKRELLKDVCGMANADGGRIVLGVEEKQGYAAEVFSIDNAEQEALRIQDIVRTGLEPTLYGLSCKQISVGGANVIVIDVASPYQKPYRRVADGKFYIRSSTQVVDMSLNEIRDQILGDAVISEKLDTIRKDRVAKIMATDFVSVSGAPAPQQRNLCTLIIHVFPLAGLKRLASVDLASAAGLALSHFLPALMSRNSVAAYARYNFEGLLFQAFEIDDVIGHTQLFRNGIVEAVTPSFCVMRLEHRSIPTAAVESQFVKASFRFIHALATIGMPPPFFIAATLANVQGSLLVRENSQLTEVLQESLALPEIRIDEIGDLQQLAKALRPAIDVLYNAAECERSPHFDAAGVWQLENSTF